MDNHSPRGQTSQNPSSMNNNSPRGQTSQNPSGMNNARAIYPPARHGMMYRNNGMQVQMANYVQPQPHQGFVPLSQPQIPSYPPYGSPYGGQELSQPSPTPGIFMQNNAVGAAYGPSPYSNPANPPHPAAASHNVVNIWNHPAEGASQLGYVSPSNVVSQPHYGYASPSIGMQAPSNVTSCGSNLSYNIPTSQAPSTAGVPAYDFNLANNQHGTFGHGQAHHGQAHHGQVQQGPMQQRSVKRRKAKHGTGQHGSNPHGLNQPGAGTPNVNTTATPSYPAQGTGHNDIKALTANFFKVDSRYAHLGPGEIETITTEFFKDVDTRYAQLGPGDIVDEVYIDWMVGQSQHGQAVVQYPSSAGSPGAGNSAGITGGHVFPPSLPADAPFTKEELRRYSALYRAYLAQFSKP